MPEFHLSSGSTVSVTASDVLRIRPTDSDFDGPDGRTRIDWIGVSLVTAKAEDVATSIMAELPTLIQLRLPGGDPVWINGAVAAGPFWVAPSARGDKITCSVTVGGKQLFISSPPEEAQQLIGGAGGKARELPQDGDLDAFSLLAPFWDLKFERPDTEGDPATGPDRLKPGVAKPFRSSNLSRDEIEEAMSANRHPMERIAIEAFARYFPQYRDLQIYEDVPEFGEGTLFLAVGSPGVDAQGNHLGPYGYQILVKNGRGTVFTDFSQTLRQGAREPHWISRYVAPDTVIAGLSVIVLMSGIVVWFMDTLRPSTHAAVTGTVTTVLGYWFGRLTPTPKDPDSVEKRAL